MEVIELGQTPVWHHNSLHAKKTRLKISQLERMRFIIVNELKLTQVGLFQFFYFMCAAANASELFCTAHLANIKSFLCRSKISF